MQMRAFVFLCCGAFASGKLIQNKLKVDINQKVYIEGNPVFGDGAGHDLLNGCQALAPSLVAGPMSPAVKVCGTSIKATFYLRGRCESYYEHSRSIGICSTSADSQSCDSFSPSEDARFGAYQSYMIEPC